MQTHLGRVLLWTSGALLSFSVMAMSVRGLAGVLNVFEIFMLRSIGGCLVLGGMALAHPRYRALLKTQRPGIHLLRNVLHFGGQVLWGQAIIVLPLAMAFALEFTSPAWVTLFAVLILRERLTVARGAAVALGFVGILIIIRPGYESFVPGAWIMVAAALVLALGVICTKALTRTDHTFTILFWMNAIQLPLYLVLSDPTFVFKLEAHHIAPAIGMMITGLTAHVCLTNAFRWGDAIVVVPLDFLRLPLMATVGWLIYAEPFDPMVFAGAAVIIAGVLWNLRAEMRGPR